MPRLVALLLAAAATAASAESDENNFTAASADEGRVKKFAAQSYDWLADRAPVARDFAAQAAAQHGPGFVGGALVAVLCMLLGGGKKQTKKGVRRASMEEAYGIDAAASAATEAADREASCDHTKETAIRHCGSTPVSRVVKPLADPP